MSTPVGVISEVPGSLRSLHRRLLPLHVAVFLQGFILWVPVEKLFMSEIGFDPATIGVMAAAYAAVVPIVEVPSGILADRWSRRGTLVVATRRLAGLLALRRAEHQRPHLHPEHARAGRVLRDVLRDARRDALRHRAGGDRRQRCVRDAASAGSG